METGLMNKLVAIALIAAASFISSQHGDSIGDGEIKRTGQGTAAGIVGVMVYAAIDMARRKEED